MDCRPVYDDIDHDGVGDGYGEGDSDMDIDSDNTEDNSISREDEVGSEDDWMVDLGDEHPPQHH